MPIMQLVIPCSWQQSDNTLHRCKMVGGWRKRLQQLFLYVFAHMRDTLHMLDIEELFYHLSAVRNKMIGVLGHDSAL